MTINDNLTAEDRILKDIEKNVLEFSKTSNKEMIYCSHFVGKGPKLYEAYEKHNVNSIEKLDEIDPNIYRLIKKNNLIEGNFFGDQMKNKGYNTIVPGEFFMKGWAQKHYMSLWEQVITRYCDSICFIDNFYSSEGCIEEFLMGIQSGKKMYHRKDFIEIDPYKELTKIKEAIEWMNDLNVDITRIYDAYRRIDLFLLD
ncbi:hypothetical protein ACFL1H_04025 [Nanoarchaeota archaeon]